MRRAVIWTHQHQTVATCVCDLLLLACKPLYSHCALYTMHGWICCRSNLGKFLDINAQLFTNEEWMSVCFYIHAGCHRGYRWIIMWQKCGGIGLNGFIFEKISKNCNIKERKKSWGLFKICLLNSTANPANLNLDWAELALLSHNNSSLASVPYLWEIFDILFQISTFQSMKMYNVYNKPIYCFLCGRIQRQFCGILEPQNSSKNNHPRFH